jgi:hypothetical protein
MCYDTPRASTRAIAFGRETRGIQTVMGGDLLHDNMRLLSEEEGGAYKHSWEKISAMICLFGSTTCWAPYPPETSSQACFNRLIRTSLLFFSPVLSCKVAEPARRARTSRAWLCARASRTLAEPLSLCWGWTGRGTWLSGVCGCVGTSPREAKCGTTTNQPVAGTHWSTLKSDSWCSGHPLGPGSLKSRGAAQAIYLYVGQLQSFFCRATTCGST